MMGIIILLLKYDLKLKINRKNENYNISNYVYDTILFLW